MAIDLESAACRTTFEDHVRSRELSGRLPIPVSLTSCSSAQTLEGTTDTATGVTTSPYRRMDVVVVPGGYDFAIDVNPTHPDQSRPPPDINKVRADIARQVRAPWEQESEVTVYLSTDRPYNVRVRWWPIQPVVPGGRMDVYACSGHQVTLGGFPSQALVGGTPRCDAIMRQWCAERPSSEAQCGCFTDVKELAVRYPGVAMPPQCMGRRCPMSGYRTNEMRTPCTVEVCRSLVEVAGKNVSALTESVVFCGAEYHDVRTGQPTGAGGNISLPNPAGQEVQVGQSKNFIAQESSKRPQVLVPYWSLAALAVLWLAIVLAGMVYRRQTK